VLARFAAAGAAGDGAALQQAAALASKIFELDPDAADAANNAGFFNRDAAVALESAAQAFCRAAAGQADQAQISELRRSAEVAPELYGTEAEKRQFRERANALLERARATMRASADAYLRAAELAPEDARVQNDTGLVFVHYLHTDLERAEAFLREAVRLGEAQLAETDPEDEGFTALTEAYGDAHENLGVLQLEFLDNPEAARNYFERSVEIGPYERPIVTRYYLPRIDGADELPLARPVTGWGQPCS
jgi:tetratricopeptide (TPR) repeat protein